MQKYSVTYLVFWTTNMFFLMPFPSRMPLPVMKHGSYRCWYHPPNLHVYESVTFRLSGTNFKIGMNAAKVMTVSY